MPDREMPDWVLLTIILDHPVSPVQAAALNKVDDLDRQIELIRDTEESDKRYAVRRGLIDYVERVQHLALPPVRATKRLH